MVLEDFYSAICGHKNSLKDKKTYYSIPTVATFDNY